MIARRGLGGAHTRQPLTRINTNHIVDIFSDDNITGVGGLVAKSVVAKHLYVDGPRVRFPADSYVFLPCLRWPPLFAPFCPFLVRFQALAEEPQGLDRYRLAWCSSRLGIGMAVDYRKLPLTAIAYTSLLPTRLCSAQFQVNLRKSL